MMKKTLLIACLFMATLLVFSYTLGIKGEFIQTNFRKFPKGIKVLQVLDNSLADEFLKPNDLIIGSAYLRAALPQNQSSSKNITVRGEYVQDPELIATPIENLESFKATVQAINEKSSNDFILFLVYRNGKYIQFSLF